MPHTHQHKSKAYTVRPVRLRTVRLLAEDVQAPMHRVEYVLRTRPYIVPAALAGKLRLFDTLNVAQVRHALNAIDARAAASLQDEIAA